MSSLIQDLKIEIKRRFNSNNKINIERKANLVVKKLAQEKSGAEYRKAYMKENLRQVRLKAKLDVQAQFKKPDIKEKVKVNLNEIIKSVSPQPKKTNANFDLGYRSLY